MSGDIGPHKTGMEHERLNELDLTPDPRRGTEHTLPAVHVLDLADLVFSTWGIAKQVLLSGTGLTVEALEVDEARVPLSAVARVLARAKELTNESGLGFFLGMRMLVPAHGYLGFAVMTAPTARHALELAARYAPTRTSVLKIELVVEGAWATLYLDEMVELGELRDSLLVALVVGIWRIGEALTGQRLHGSADLMFEAPPYADRFENAALPVRFGQPRNAIRFEAQLLDLPLTMAHPTALKLAQEQCERALERLDRDDLVMRVRSFIVNPEGGFRSLEEVASKLMVSTRTLKRKLKAEGSAFSEVLDAVQRERACELLLSEQLSMEEVAERSGYSDVSNFTRAFKRWTQQTPAAYRRAHEKGPA